MLKREISLFFIAIMPIIFCVSNVNAETKNTVIVDNSFDVRFIGKWEITEHGVEYEILKSGKTIIVKGSDVENSEAFEVYDVKWKEPLLFASFKMPSTGHVTHSQLKVMNQNLIEDRYTGDATGKDSWKRKGAR